MSGHTYNNGSPRVLVRGARVRSRVLAALVVGVIALATSSCKLPTIDIGFVDFSLVEAGSYEGYWDGDMVKARVAVSADDGRVTDIRILKHECGMGSPAEAIVGRVVERQSLQVDTVSGATYSSRVILRAIENALTGR